MKDIFISYNWESKPVVQEIRDLLQSINGYKIWLDNYAMNAGDSLHGEIKKGIDNCKLFVAFITKKYCESKNCQAEIKYAFQQKKKCIYVKLENDLGKDEEGIELLIAGSLWINGYDYQNHDDWPEKLYYKLTNDIQKHLNTGESPELVDLERLIICRVCKERFNLVDDKIDICRRPMQTNCNLHIIHENLLCMKCLKERKVTNGLGVAAFVCPFDGNEHLVSNCTDTKRFHSIIKYFEVKSILNSSKQNVDKYGKLKSVTTNRMVLQVNESKRKIRERVEEVIKELNNYATQVIEILDKSIEEWQVKQERINDSLKIDEIMKLTEDSINELENDMKLIEIAVKRNDSSSVDDDVNLNFAKIMNINETITMLNDQIKHESKKLNDSKGLSFRKCNKISDFGQVAGIIEKNRLFHDTPEIVNLCSTKDDNFVKIKELVEQQNANVNFKNYDGDTALICAALNGHLETVKYLIENGANVNEKNNYGNTAIISASLNGHLGIVKFLIESGSFINDKNNYGSSGLYWASYNGHLETVKFLIEAGAKINEKNNYGHTPLNAAQLMNKNDAFDYLKSKGAK